ncbi:MAG: class I SAM-dependent methyltransferase [Betaproteobacteria bacterium]|nr:MAG: class I SAM-dependent methyltransferase [Betaproteobacteria bacterium]
MIRLFRDKDPGSPDIRACPVCGQSGARPIGRIKTNVLVSLERGEYDLAQCQACELIYISPQPSACDLRRMYVETTQFDNPVYTDPARVTGIMEYMSACLARILQRTSRTANGVVSVLEVGAGLAWMCRAAKSLSPKNFTVAQDISPEAAERCPWVDLYLLKDIFDASLEQRAPYHVISLTHVIEHLVDPIAVIRRCKSLLRADGVIFTTAPHRPIGWRKNSQGVSLWESYSYNHVPAHIQYFSKKSMRALARKAGCTLDYWSHAHEQGQAFEAWLR